MSLFDELKRRNVFRVGIAYALVGWLIMQVTDTFSPALRLPEWFPTAVAFLLLIGLPVALFFAWAYELTPDGLRRDSEVDPQQSIAPQNARKLDRMIIVALLAVVAVLLIDRYMGGPDHEPDSTGDTSSLPASDPESPARTATLPDDDRISVAVLPFVNMSDDQQNEYFSDGISEELLNVLVGIKGLRVPSRTSSFTFKNSEQSLAEIGQALMVDHLLEGSVRKADQRIRVTAQLIDVRSDTHLWSETFTRELDDVFAVQDEIAQAIVSALRVTLSLEDQQRLSTHSTDNVEAYNKYLLGRHFWNQRSAQPLLAAIEPLREAVEMDPGFDQAWAALADTYVLIPEYGGGLVQDFIPLARQATEKALSLNPDSARALTTRGYYKILFDFDAEGSITDYQRAIELEPGYATAYQWYGETLIILGRMDEALEQMRLAEQADPLSAIIRHTKAYMYMHANLLDEAEKYYREALALDPGLPISYSNLAVLYLRKRNFEESRANLHEYSRLAEVDVSARLAVVDAVEDPALKPRALELLAEPGALFDGVFGKAMEHALLEEYELALDNLEFAFNNYDPLAIHMNWVQIYEPLHDDPRFQAMLEKMNLLP